MLTGTNFDRALRGLQLVDEALNRWFLVHFRIWCKEINHPIPEDVTKVLAALTEDMPMAEVIYQLMAGP